MTNLIKDKYVRGNKEHVCSLCGEKIQYRALHRYVQVRKDKHVHSQRFHQECSDAIEDYCGENNTRKWDVDSVMKFVCGKLKYPSPYIHSNAKKLYG